MANVQMYWQSDKAVFDIKTSQTNLLLDFKESQLGNVAAPSLHKLKA